MLALYILGGLILLILLVAALIGTKWKFERSILIHAPVAKVWDNVNSLHAINRWNPWLDRDPHLHQEYAGTDGTPGATYAWDSPEKNVGAGNQTIVTIKEGSEMTSRINMNIIKLTGIMEKNLDRDFTKGLGQLKALSEK